ncbi:MAG: transcription antitermination factor NusB [Azoarcus sp.]|jgi:N utilization substance protein B|nr:transcription antitermination factor NusB [Azoarcus sp.]
MSREGRREIAARHRARELALQGIYQWLLHNTPATNRENRPAARLQPDEQPPQAQLLAIEELIASAQEGKSATRAPTATDAGFFATLLQGVIADAETLRALFAPLLTRTVAELSPVEHAILLLSAFELRRDIETPYRVIINEAIELAKKYGGADGHKFVNGVLDRLVGNIRPEEVAATRAGQ